MKIYESVIDIVQGDATMLFVNLSYTLATEEAERIGVDHVVRTSTHEHGGKSAGKRLDSQSNKFNSKKKTQIISFHFILNFQLRST